MAKNFITGLPDTFNLNVSSQDLIGDQLPGYLDEDPVLELAKARQRLANTEKTTEHKQEEQKVVELKKPEVDLEKQVAAQIHATPTRGFIPVAKEERQEEVKNSSPKKVYTRRLNAHVTPDTERKFQELLNMLSIQSPGSEIRLSDLIQALIINIYEARGEINISRLPQRGRWGSPMAKAFPVSLAESLREALVEHDKKTGGNPFKKAVGI